MFKSLAGLVGDIVEIASAPVEVAVDLTRAVTKPVADIAQEVVRELKEVVDDPNDTNFKL